MTTDRLLFAALSSLLFAGAASEDCSFDVMNDFRGLDFSVGEIASVESTVYRSESSVAYLDKFASDVQTADTDRSQVMFYRSTSDPDVLSFYWVQPAGVAMQVFISNLPTDGIHVFNKTDTIANNAVFDWTSSKDWSADAPTGSGVYIYGKFDGGREQVVCGFTGLRMSAGWELQFEFKMSTITGVDFWAGDAQTVVNLDVNSDSVWYVRPHSMRLTFDGQVVREYPSTPVQFRYCVFLVAQGTKNVVMQFSTSWWKGQVSMDRGRDSTPYCFLFDFCPEGVCGGEYARELTLRVWDTRIACGPKNAAFFTIASENVVNETISPETSSPPTIAPTTAPTLGPVTDAPTTSAPRTNEPTTPPSETPRTYQPDIPSTASPPTSPPSTTTPATNFPQTMPPNTSFPETRPAATSTPVTRSPPTNPPDTRTPQAPPSPSPKTSMPDTPETLPGTNAPSTSSPATSLPSFAPSTNTPSSAPSNTSSPLTNAPATTTPPTTPPATKMPDTPETLPGTNAPSTSIPATSLPSFAPSTSTPSFAPSNTSSPLTNAPTTKTPPTTPPATKIPGTKAPSTSSPATRLPSSAPPTSTAPSNTSSPVTNAPATMTPPTTPPATKMPDTPETLPGTKVPSTSSPATKLPSSAPTGTSSPLTNAPATKTPLTTSPETKTPPEATFAPRTGTPSSAPSTAQPSSAPSTAEPSSAPATAEPSSAPATESPPTTLAPATAVPNAETDSPDPDQPVPAVDDSPYDDDENGTVPWSSGAESPEETLYSDAPGWIIPVFVTLGVTLCALSSGLYVWRKRRGGSSARTKGKAMRNYELGIDDILLEETGCFDDYVVDEMVDFVPPAMSVAKTQSTTGADGSVSKKKSKTQAKKDVSHEYEQTFIDPDLSIVVDKGEMLSRSGTFKRLTSQKTSLDRSQGLGNINASEEVLE